MIVVVTDQDRVVAAGCTCCGFPEDGVLTIPSEVRLDGESWEDLLRRVTGSVAVWQ